MRIASTVVVVAIVVVAHGAPSAQHIVPPELLTGRTLIVTGNLDFETLRHAVNEFRNQGRFDLTNQEGAADLMAYFSPKVDERDMTLTAAGPVRARNHHGRRGRIQDHVRARSQRRGLQRWSCGAMSGLWRGSSGGR